MKVTSLIIPNVKKLITPISLHPALAHHKRHQLPSVIHFRPESSGGSDLLSVISVNTSSKMTKYQPVTHVIFDMDGLILDTEKIYHKLLGAIAMKYNKEFTWDVRMKVMGTTEQDCAKIMVDGLKLPITPEEFHREQIESQAKVLGSADLMPGSERLIRHLHSKGVPIAVATSSSTESVFVKIAKHSDLFTCFNHIVSGTSDPEVKRGKPHPDIFLVCASRFDQKPDPEKCLIFEDAPAGVQAGREAGMQVVMVPDRSTEVEKRQGATMVIESLLDFKPELFGLPAFD